jgi:hypothetical protein
MYAYPSVSHRVNGHSHMADKSGSSGLLAKNSSGVKGGTRLRFCQGGVLPAKGACRCGGGSIVEAERDRSVVVVLVMGTKAEAVSAQQAQGSMDKECMVFFVWIVRNKEETVNERLMEISM